MFYLFFKLDFLNKLIVQFGFLLDNILLSLEVYCGIMGLDGSFFLIFEFFNSFEFYLGFKFWLFVDFVNLFWFFLEIFCSF